MAKGRPEDCQTNTLRAFESLEIWARTWSRGTGRCEIRPGHDRKSGTESKVRDTRRRPSALFPVCRPGILLGPEPRRVQVRASFACLETRTPTGQRPSVQVEDLTGLDPAGRGSRDQRSRGQGLPLSGTVLLGLCPCRSVCLRWSPRRDPFRIGSQHDRRLYLRSCWLLRALPHSYRLETFGSVWTFGRVQALFRIC